MGLARKAHLGIRHMVNVVRFVIWWESGGTHRDRNQKHNDLLQNKVPPFFKVFETTR